jgi:hypothetical protein
VTEPQDSPEGTVSDIAIVPEKPFSDVRVIVDVSEDPGATVAGDVAPIVKSRKLKVVVVEWVSDPLVPVIVRV